MRQAVKSILTLHRKKKAGLSIQTSLRPYDVSLTYLS